MVTVRLRVTDNGGLSDTDQLTDHRRHAADRRDQLAGCRARRGAAVTRSRSSGSATDASGNPITGTALSWRINLEHCNRTSTSCHTHVVQNLTGSGGSFVAPDHEYPSHLELELTATDADGPLADRHAAARSAHRSDHGAVEPRRRRADARHRDRDGAVHARRHPGLAAHDHSAHHGHDRRSAARLRLLERRRRPHAYRDPAANAGHVHGDVPALDDADAGRRHGRHRPHGQRHRPRAAPRSTGRPRSPTARVTTIRPPPGADLDGERARPRPLRRQRRPADDAAGQRAR